MPLNPEQKQAVSSWVAAGDNLSLVQKKLAEQFKISLTYMDVRFLVDDLGLELKNAAPKADVSDLSKAQAAQPTSPGAGAPPPHDAGEVPGDPADGLPAGDLPADDLPPEAAGDIPAPGGISLEVDRIMRPGTVVSGSVTFSDGVSGKWALDQMGRLMLETPQKGYKPSPADVQAFQQELQAQLQRQGY